MAGCAQPFRNLPEQLHSSFFGQQIARARQSIWPNTQRKCFEPPDRPQTFVGPLSPLQPLGYRVILDSRLIALS